MATETGIVDAIKNLADSFDADLMRMSEQDLEDNWHFKFDKDASLESNLYNFYDMLQLYGYFCKEWEEAKNGSCCIVERVRDKLMPKINEFAEDVKAMRVEE